jgi:uncharacterized surface anchored protein
MRSSREIQHNQLDSARHVTEKRFAPARNVDCHTERAVMSDADGAFPMADLEPGRYEVVATKRASGLRRLKFR